MVVHAQREEVEQVVEVDFPVRLGVGRERQVLARLLARDAGGEPLVVRAALAESCRARFLTPRATRPVERGSPALPCRLSADCMRHLSGGVLCAASMATE